MTDSTRHRVQQAARKLGYRPAQRKAFSPMAGNVVRRFGFLYVEQTSLVEFDPVGFQPALQLFMRDSLAMKARFEMFMLDSELDEPGLREKLTELTAQLDGVLLFGRVHAPVVAILNQLGRPSVVIGETDISANEQEQLRLQRVTDDPLCAGRLATDYLLRRGRRRIAFVGGVHAPGFFYDQWYEGYLLAHAKAGVPVDPKRVMWHEMGGNPLGNRIADLTRDDARPDAIVWPDASIATGNRRALRQLGFELPPEDEVIGHMSHVPALHGQEHYPQILSNLEAMTEEAIRRLQAVCRHEARRAASITVPNIIRNMNG